MRKEEWRPVRGLEGRYDVSSLGRVRSYYSRWGKRKQPRLVGSFKGLYPTVSLPDENENHQNVYIHILVATAFIPNPFNYPEVNHIDGNKHNNAVTNLEWVTHRENMRHASKMNLFGFQKKCVCVETGEVFDSITKAGMCIGRKQPSMSDAIIKGKPIKGYHYKVMEE